MGMEDQTQANPRDMLTVADVAGLLNISKRHVYELIQQGQISCVRLGRVVRVPRGVIDRMINAALETPIRGT